jgi:predicted dehydrogenase/protoporphyrinogen oxidase
MSIGNSGSSDSASSIRIGVVGLGYWGPNIVRNLADSKPFELAAVCDLRPHTLDAVSDRYPELTCTTAFEELLNDSSIDAVAIATPVSTHYPLAMAALEAGKHVFVEKPLATSSEQVLELTSVARDRGLVLMPGHTFLYSPAVTAIKRLIDAGELGQIYFVSSSRVNLGLHQADASVVWDLGPHDFSILRYWLDAVPSQVSAISRSCVFPGTPDVAFISMTYPSGTVAHVELSWLAPSKLRRTAIVGSEKMVVYDDTSSEPIRIFDSGAELPDPETFGEYQLSYRTGEIVSPRLEAVEPLALELDDFAAAISGEKSLVSSPEVGLDVVRTIEAVDRSLANGGVPVLVAEEEPLDLSLQARIDDIKIEATGSHPAEPTGVREDDGHIGTAILGGGPAGLTAAYVLARRGQPGLVFEADGTPGGIAKSVEFKGFRFDLGGHRFFTKLKPIQRLWEDMLGEELLTRPRLSRIYFNGKFFAYPITAKDVVGRLGIRESVLCAMSYLWASRRGADDSETFEEWVTARFGRRLYDAFFRSYTEKVWGIPGSEIRSLWAAQRIKNFSLGKAILDILGIRREHVTTLIEEFRYPRLGPGQMWDAFATYASANGVPVRLKQRCISIKHADRHVESVVVQSNGDTNEHTVDGVVSSIALSDLILSLDPPAPPEVQDAARSLRYRDLVLVALMTAEEKPFPDNWIYLHDPETRAGRVQNYGAWSSDMVRPGTTCLGVEYFCFKGDEIWEMREDEIVALATEELARIGLIDARKVLDGVKVVVPKAYPMYDSEYEDALEVIRPFLAEFDNLQTCGRNGLHRYNNQDHSMWTAILATVNLLEGTREHDVWSVNVDEVHLEEGEAVDALLGVDLLATPGVELTDAASAPSS